MIIYKKRKKIQLIYILLSLFSITGSLKGQEDYKIHSIESQYGKASHLIFPSSIEDFDIGEPQEFNVVKKENILKIYPLTKEPIITNILVKTSQEDYFSFTLKNLPKTSYTDYFLKKEDASYSTKEHFIKDLRYFAVDKKRIREDKIEVDLSLGCQEALQANNYLANRGDLYKLYEKENQKVKVRLSGIFINESNMYIKLNLINNSAIKFSLANINLSIKGNKKAHYSVQSKKIPIINKCKKVRELSPLGEFSEVVVIKNITLLKKESLIIDIFELPEGNRHLSLKLPSSIFIKAKSLF